MSEPFLYKSSLARFMREFIDLKESAGIVALHTKWILLEIDKYYLSEGIKEPVVTSQIVAGWRKTRANDSDRTLYTKYSVWNQLTRFMSRQGHECYIPPLPQYGDTAKGFTPYIFSHEEIRKMLAKADGLRLYDLHMSCGLIYLPAVLRLLYSTGLRISEAMSIKNEDVNFDERHIVIRKSKNGSERLVPLGKPMADVLRQYVAYRNRMPVRDVSAPSSFLFVKMDGTPGSAGNVYKWFRRILKESGIPFMGDHKGPRVHDLRHTFAVHALVHMARNGMDLYTIKSYAEAFAQFITYMRDERKTPVERLTLDKVNKENVTGFLGWITGRRGCGNATRNYRLAAMCSFAHYMQYEDVGRLSNWQQILSVKALKTEKRTINYLTVDGIKLLLEQPDTETVKGRRDLAMLALMYDTAARVQEIIDLTPDNVRADAKPYTIRLVGKGRKSRIVPLMEEQVRILRNYMDEHRLHGPEKRMSPLFFNNRGEKLTRVGVSFILDNYVRKARCLRPEIIPDKVSCHSMRHSKAMHLLQAGVNLVYIRDILGHTSISTTDVYARADSKHKREALEKAYVDIGPKDKEERLWEKDKNLLEWLQTLK